MADTSTNYINQNDEAELRHYHQAKPPYEPRPQEKRLGLLVVRWERVKDLWVFEVHGDVEWSKSIAKLVREGPVYVARRLKVDYTFRKIAESSWDAGDLTCADVQRTIEKEAKKKLGKEATVSCMNTLVVRARPKKG